MFLVVFILNLAAARGLIDTYTHRLAYVVRVHYDAAVLITRSTSDRLDERCLCPQEAFLVGVEYRDERHLRKVESLPEQVDSHEHVELAHSQIADDLEPLKVIYLGVQVPYSDALLLQVFREVFSHALGKGRYQYALALRGCLVYLADQIVDLSFRRPYLDFRIEQSSRPDQLLGCDSAGSFKLVLRRSSRDIHRLSCQLRELLESERSVIERRWQSESVFDQRFLACAVAVIHGAKLREHRMRLIYDSQEIPVREVIEQRVRPLARLEEVDVAGVVLDALAGADLHHHLYVVVGALLEPLGLKQFTVRPEPVQSLT